jgi:hypothetical protein
MPRPISWLFKKLGYRDPDYRGDDFSVRVEKGFREIVTIFHTRRRTTRRLDGELIGKRWEGIAVYLPDEVDTADVPQIVRDLETAFGALRYSYVISRKVGVEAVSDAERQAAVTELNEMGFEVEVSSDGQQASLKWRSGVARPDMETVKGTTPRVMSLVKSLRSTRPRVEILARSKEFPEG